MTFSDIHEDQGNSKPMSHCEIYIASHRPKDWQAMSGDAWRETDYLASMSSKPIQMKKHLGKKRVA